MSSQNHTIQSHVVQSVDDAISEAAEDFVVVDDRDVPEAATVTTIDPMSRKTAKVIVCESEDDDEEDEEVPQGEDGDFLADYPDDTEACFFITSNAYN